MTTQSRVNLVQERLPFDADDATRPVHVDGFVYFVASESEDVIKIGYTSKKPSIRLAELSRGVPFTLKPLAYKIGSREWEQRIHRRFASLRLRGEWFTLTAQLKSFIERVATPWPCDPVFLLDNAHMEVERDGEEIYRYSSARPPVSPNESAWWMARKGENPGTLVRYHGRIVRTYGGKIPEDI